jgi:hypothetical protein
MWPQIARTSDMHSWHASSWQNRGPLVAQSHIMVIMQLYQSTTTILIFNSSLPNELAAPSYIWIATNPSCICIKDMKHTLLQLSVTKNLILFTVLHEHKNTGEKYFEYFCDYQQIKTSDYYFLSYLNLQCGRH